MTPTTKVLIKQADCK